MTSQFTAMKYAWDNHLSYQHIPELVFCILLSTTMSLEDLVLLPRRRELQATFFENLRYCFFLYTMGRLGLHHRAESFWNPWNRRRLNSDAITDKVVVKKIRQFCLLNENNNLPPGYTQGQLAEVLGVDQSLVSRAFSSATDQLSPITNKNKRQKRSDAFELQHADVVVVMGDFWVWIQSSCTILNLF